MKVAIAFGAPYAADIKEIQLESQITYVVEAERLGVDSAWTAEAWGYDAITPLAYAAAKTSRIRLGTGIMQIGSRTPAMIAMTALAMAALSQDRLFLAPIEEGARKAGRSLADLDLLVTAGTVAFTDDLEPLLASLKVPLAFSLGAMGSRQHNFYNAVFQRAGYADLALRIQDLWLQGQRREAIVLIPDDLVLKTNLIGTKEMVRERLRLYQRPGVT